MLEFIKGFWVALSIKNWTFENRKLANPLIIIWKIALVIPMHIILFIFALAVSLFNLDLKDFINTWEEYSIF